jgi:hypothetical protein
VCTYYHPIIKRFGLKSKTIDGYPADIFVQPIITDGSVPEDSHGLDLPPRTDPLRNVPDGLA